MNRRTFSAGLPAAALGLGLLTTSRAGHAQPAASRSGTPAGGVASRIGLALGAGSARGFSHIGVLKALDEAGLQPDVIAGTSAGSLVGVFYAAGYSPWQIEEVALRVRDIDIADFSTATKRGMLSGAALQKLVNEYLRNVPLERLKIPFAAVATNLRTGDAAVLTQGDAGAAVRASCSIPGVFIPTTVNGQELVDGGLVSPLPVRAARALGADFVIGVDVSSKPGNDSPAGLYEVMLQSFEIMSRRIVSLESQTADFMIRPDTLRFSSTDFSVRKELIQAGYEAGRAAVAGLRAKVATKPRRRG